MNATLVKKCLFVCWLFLVLASVSDVPCNAEPIDVGAAGLTRYVGTWRCDGHFASGKPISANLKFEWVPKIHALLKLHDDISPGQYHAMEIWVSEKSGAFSNTIIDSFSGKRNFRSTDIRDGVLRWVGDDSDVSIDRFEYVWIDADQFRLDWFVSKVRKDFVLGDTLLCVRDK